MRVIVLALSAWLVLHCASASFSAEPEELKIENEYRKRRAAMVEEHLSKTIRDSRVLAAMGTVPREIFIRPGLRFRAYRDDALPVERKQFLSRPYDWARGAELLAAPDQARVLVLDPGIGYGGAVASQLAKESWAVVTVPELHYFVQTRYETLSYSNLFLKAGPVEEGWSRRAPFDRIWIVGAMSGPIPRALFDQLQPGGILLSVEGKEYQHWVRYRKTEEGIVRDVLDRCEFPPIGG